MTKVQIDVEDRVNRRVARAQYEIEFEKERARPNKREVIERALKWLCDQELFLKAVVEDDS